MLGNPHGGRKKWNSLESSGDGGCGSGIFINIVAIPGTKALCPSGSIYSQQFPSMQYIVTNFENYQYWIPGPSQRYSFMLEVPTMGKTWHAIRFSWFICVSNVQDVSMSIRIHRRPHNESAPVCISIITQSDHFMSLSDAPCLPWSLFYPTTLFWNALYTAF